MFFRGREKCNKAGEERQESPGQNEGQRCSQTTASQTYETEEKQMEKEKETLTDIVFFVFIAY